MDIRHRNRVTVLGDQGPTLLYAHGFGCSQGMWRQVTPAFAGTHRQVLFDYVGSGQADRQAFDLARYSTLDGYAQDLIDVCDSLGLQSGVVLIAHSVSCSIGLMASLRRPGLFERMVLVGPSPCFLNHPPDYLGGFEREDLEGLLSLMDQNFIGWADYLAPIVAGAPHGSPVSTELNTSFCSTDPETARVFAQATFFADNRADLPQVRVPCLILQHAHDALAPTAVGDYLHQHLAGSRLQVLDVVGHCAHLSAPEQVVDAIRDELARALPA